MTDIALRFSPDLQSADIALQGGALATDDGLMTAIVISLFTDARARPDDVLPEDGADPRGWWGNIGNADANDEIGSRLWLLVREKLLPATALKARDIVREALAWLLDAGVIRSLDVDTAIEPVSARNPSGALAIGVTIARPTGPARERYDFLWDATGRSFSVQ